MIYSVNNIIPKVTTFFNISLESLKLFSVCFFILLLPLALLPQLLGPIHNRLTNICTTIVKVSLTLSPCSAGKYIVINYYFPSSCLINTPSVLFIGCLHLQPWVLKP